MMAIVVIGFILAAGILHGVEALESSIWRKREQKKWRTPLKGACDGGRLQPYWKYSQSEYHQ